MNDPVRSGKLSNLGPQVRSPEVDILYFSDSKKVVKAPALKESSFGTKGDRQTFFDQIFNFCLHNIIVRKVLSNFCFWGPIRFVHWLEIDPVPSWRPGFFGLTGKPDLKKFYLFKDKSFWLEIFFIFQGYARATFLYTFHSRWTSGKFSG